MKKLNKNNKGFSLVELLVVIAIMVVLVGVIAPSLLSNIEKTRESKDIQALDTIAGNIQAAMTNEKVYDAIIKKAGAPISLSAAYTGTAFATTPDDAGKKLAALLNDSLNVSAVFDGATFGADVAADVDDKKTKLCEGKEVKKALAAGTDKIYFTVDVTTGRVTVLVSTDGTTTNTCSGKSVEYRVER